VSAKTTIEWTDRTWNPVTGCTKISPGCAHCYAERITERFHGAGSFEKVVLHPDRLEEPLSWRAPQRVFVNSMSDLFHDDVPGDFIDHVWTVMREAPQHTFQILTKRAERMLKLMRHYPPLSNVWLGVSVENQHFADERIELLMQTPAAVKFISAEPLLGHIFLQNHFLLGIDGLDWVICGGESGPGARPMDSDWVRSLRDQCTAAGVPFFFKQWGGRNKKVTGRELDGLEWNQFPHARRGAA
jgi:protein gp37